MTTTPLDRPVILAVLSSKTTQCTGDGCSTPIAIGDRAAFDCTRGPGVLCWPCAEAIGGRFTRTLDEPATPAADAGTAGDEPCACPTTAGGFTDAGDGRYVHAACGRPTRQALDAERARTGATTTPAEVPCGVPGPRRDDDTNRASVEPGATAPDGVGAAGGRPAGGRETADAEAAAPAPDRVDSDGPAGAVDPAPAPARAAAAPEGVAVDAPAGPAHVTAPPARTDGFRILFTGPRDYNDRDLAGRAFENALAEVTGTVDVDEGIAGLVTVVHGQGDGLDAIVDELARARRCVVEPHPAAWDREGRVAGPIRNERMAALGADLCVAFVDGAGPGTLGCVDAAERAGIPVRRVSREFPDGVLAGPAGDGPDLRGCGHHDGPEVDELNSSTGPVAPRFEHDEPIGPTPCRCGDGTVDGTHHDDQPCAHTSDAGDQPRPLADLSPWVDEGIAYGTDPNVVAAEMIEAVRLGILAGDLRGRQKEIGPSEVGHPCPRALAYRLAGTPHTGTEDTPWRQRVGTLVHADNDDHLAADNERRGVRWLTNLRVRTGELYPGRPIDGTLDVFDVQTGTVIDEKVPGSTAMKTYGKGKPEAVQYRIQLQLYGRGCLHAGYRPAWVGTMRISPARELSEYIADKFEPFDEQVGIDALSRAGGIARMVDQLGQRAPALLPGVEHVCHRCPWLRRGSTDLATGCPGVDTPRPTRRAPVDDLVG